MKNPNAHSAAGQPATRPPLPANVAQMLARAAEYSEPIQVNMRPREWRALADHLGLPYTPNSRSSLS